MLIPLLIGAAFFTSMKAVSLSGSAVAAAIPLGLQKDKKRLQRDQRLGLKTVFYEDQQRLAAENKKKGKMFIPAMPEALEPFVFKKEFLPESMHWLCSQEWLLTQSEFVQLFAMVRRDMLDRGEGDFAETTKAMSSRTGIDYQELASHVRLVSGPIDYVHLMWLSDNRMADPLIKKKLATLR